ncbi:unnamed protein product [Ixodes persulcatus]
MKYRDYRDDWVFTNFQCVSRWGGRDKRPSDPINIRYEKKDYTGDIFSRQYETLVLFYKNESDKFYYNVWRDYKGKLAPQKRQLIYMNLEEQCQVTKTFYNESHSGCTLWMGYDKVDGSPPPQCEDVYNKCGGSTKLKYHDNCKYKPPPRNKH